MRRLTRVATQPPKPALVWEARAALLILALLTLQWFQEAVATWLDRWQSGALEHGAVYFFYGLPFLFIAWGLLKRNDTAWWCGVVLGAGLGAMLLHVERRTLDLYLTRWELRDSPAQASNYPLEYAVREFLWLAARIGMHFALALLLLLGGLRERLRRRDSQPVLP